ncbi:MAG: glycosyltransferase family 39 protein [Patescibacteria group bacterium]
MKFIARLEKSKDFWFLLMTSFIFFILRLPSLFEPYWYGDEGIYEVLGSAMRHGRILYQGIWDNKPPLLYIVYAIFNGDQFYARIASLIFGVFAVIAFFFLAKKIFGEGNEKRETVLWSTSIFAFLFGLPLLEGNIANAENFMLFPIILSALLLFKDKLKPKTYFLAGILLGIAFLFKIVAVFDFAAFCTFIFMINTEIPRKKINIGKLSQQTIILLYPFVIGFIIPLLLTSLFFLGAPFKYFVQATFVQNVGYVGYGNKLLIPQGFLILKLLILAGFNTYLFLRKEKFSKALLFVLVWFSFSIFNAFFAQRPYTHYLLVLLPGISLMIGMISFERKYKPQLAVLFAISIILIFTNFGLYGKTPFYYQNFISFITGSKTVRDYRAFFDKKTPVDYDIAEYIKLKAKEDDQIFIWGNNAQVYKLTGKLPPGRYAVAYHMTNYKDGFENTQEAIQKNPPKFVVIMPNQPVLPFSLYGYINAVTIENVSIYERAL